MEAAISQKHGTILVIICENEETVGDDVRKLLHISSGTALEATALNAKYVKRLTAIDGALIIDHEGHGYGFGTKGNSGYCIGRWICKFLFHK